MPSAENDALYLYDDPTIGWHDIRCKCSRHCRNCRAETDGTRLYCSTACGRRYRAGLAFDRAMSSVIPPGRNDGVVR